MLQLNILCGKKAGTQWVTRRFPVRIGRAATADLSLDDDGVWDSHVEIGLQPQAGFLLSVQSGARAAVNTRPVEQVLLRNGDLIELGAARLQFSLSPTRPRGLRWREALTWLALAALCLGQVALIYWLPG